MTRFYITGFVDNNATMEVVGGITCRIYGAAFIDIQKRYIDLLKRLNLAPLKV